MFSKLQYVLVIAVACLAIGCTRNTPPAPIAEEKNPTQLTGEAKAVYDAEQAAKSGDTSEETMKRTAGVAGGKTQPNSGGGN